jgi:hypothetical protein
MAGAVSDTAGWRGSSAVAVPMMAVVAGIVSVKRRALAAVHTAVGIVVVSVWRHAAGRGGGRGGMMVGSGVGVDAGQAGGVVVVGVLGVFRLLSTHNHSQANLSKYEFEK